MDVDAFTREFTGRPVSLFAADLERSHAVIAEQLRGARILVSGGAGSVGSAVVKQLLDYWPAQVDVVDPSENSLAELVRDIRSSALGMKADALATFTMGIGSPMGTALIEARGPYDRVLNFAACKHVRTERDPLSLLQMIDVNLVQSDALHATLRRQGVGHAFSISTDKAAYPASLMGASKRLMEYLLFDHAARLEASGVAPRVTTTRFANVAFSDGSLLTSFQNRLAKGQPLAGPSDVTRFFYTHEEAAHLCLLAAFATPTGHVLVPTLQPESDLVNFRDIAVRFVQLHGLEPRFYEHAPQARAAMAADRAAGRYPCVFLASDTDGEKLFEEFVMDHETPTDIGLSTCRAIAFQETGSAARLHTFLADIGRLMQSPLAHLKKSELVARFEAALPELRHVDHAGSSLDRKM